MAEKRVEPECSATKLCPLNACCSSAGSCGMTSDFCGAGCLSGCYTPSLRICGNPPVRNDMRYYRRSEQSRGAEEEFFRSFKNGTAGYTHITYAFTPIKDGMLASADAEEEELLSRLVELKRYSPNLKVMTSVGGWNFNNPGETRYEFSNTISSRRSRSRFIESVRDYLERNRLDGIDIAYQYPGAVDRGGTESDSRNYLKLMRELRRNLGRRYLITMVSPATFAYMQFFNIGPMSREVDWINLFAFDSHGMWDRENWFGNVIRPATEDKLMQASVDFLVHQGVQPEKFSLECLHLGGPTNWKGVIVQRSTYVASVVQAHLVLLQTRPDTYLNPKFKEESKDEILHQLTMNCRIPIT